MSRLNGHAQAVREEALSLCGGVLSERTTLVAVAMHAHICNLCPTVREIPPKWRRWLGQESVKDADAVLAAMKGGQ